MGFNNINFVFIGPQFAQWNFWRARSQSVGWDSIIALIVGRWHFGQCSTQNNFKDMMLRYATVSLSRASKDVTQLTAAIAIACASG
jgi:hypothetical protein